MGKQHLSERCPRLLRTKLRRTDAPVASAFGAFMKVESKENRRRRSSLSSDH